MVTTHKHEKQAARWCQQLTGGMNLPRSEIVKLAECAFLLYKNEWPKHEIVNWRWPFDQLKEVLDCPEIVRNGAIEGYFPEEVPWNVLFRRALWLYFNKPKCSKCERTLSRDGKCHFCEVH